MERFIWKRHKDIFKGVGIYHITFVVNGMQRLLGELAIDHEEPRCLPSDLGRAISHDLDEIQQRRPYVRLLAKQSMPAANQRSPSSHPLSVPVLRSLTALPPMPNALFGK